MNKRHVPFLYPAVLLALISAFILTGCKSMGTTIYEIPDEYYREAISEVLDLSSDRAITRMYNFLQNNDFFVPSEYAVLRENQNDIMGIKVLLDQWEMLMTEYCLDSFQDFSAYIADLCSRLVIENPRTLVEKSDRSISRHMEETYLNEITETVEAAFLDIDLGIWNRMLSQMESWTATQKLLGNKDVLDIPSDNPVSLSARDLAVLYLTFLSDEEELIRTTPDPYASSALKLVFGLD